MAAYLEIAETSATTLAQTGDKSLFTVSGRCVVHSIVGITTVDIQDQANATLLKVNPTVGADVDLCAALDIVDDAAGTIYNITGTFADALVGTTSGAVIAQVTPFIVAAGIIELECAANNTGNVRWICRWEPLDADSTIVPAC